MSGIRSDGSTASYYELPARATELQHLISHRNMNAQIGEIFRACYRYGMASHSDMRRDAKKILFYAKAEVERLEGGAQSGANTNETRMDAGNDVVPDSPWVDWNGGTCPVPDKTRVVVSIKGGGIICGPARGFEWDIWSSESDIIAYRILEDA